MDKNIKDQLRNREDSIRSSNRNLHSADEKKTETLNTIPLVIEQENNHHRLHRHQGNVLTMTIRSNFFFYHSKTLKIKY